MEILQRMLRWKEEGKEEQTKKTEEDGGRSLDERERERERGREGGREGERGGREREKEREYLNFLSTSLS